MHLPSSCLHCIVCTLMWMTMLPIPNLNVAVCLLRINPPVLVREKLRDATKSPLKANKRASVYAGFSILGSLFDWHYPPSEEAPHCTREACMVPSRSLPLRILLGRVEATFHFLPSSAAWANDGYWKEKDMSC